jgi:anti-anti-sigma factor
MARTSSKTATVRAMWDAWNQEGIDAFLAIAPPDVEWRPSVAGGKALWGSRDIRDFFKAMEDRGEHIEAEIAELEEIGEDAVLVIGTLRRRGPHGTAVDQMAWLYLFRDGKLWRATAHHNAEEARQAARFASAALPASGERQPVMTIAEAENDDGSAELTLRGELDLASAPQLGAALRRLAQPGRTVRVDLAGLVFMDSTGMRSILEANRDAQRDGWTLVLGRASETVQRVFAMSGVEKMLPFEPEGES